MSGGLAGTEARAAMQGLDRRNEPTQGRDRRCPPDRPASKAKRRRQTVAEPSEILAANQADREPFDFQRRMTGVHDDGLEVRVGGQ